MADRPPRIKVDGSPGLQAAFDAITSYLGRLTGNNEANRVQPGVGVNMVRGGKGGTVIEAQPSGSFAQDADCPHTFILIAGTSPSTRRVRLLKPGTIYPAGAADNCYEGGEAWTSAAFAADSVQWVRAYVLTDGTTATSWSLELSAEPADPIGILEEVAPASFRIDLALIAGGRVQRVIGCGNLSVAPSLSLETDKAEPLCAETPTVGHYTWAVAPA